MRVPYFMAKDKDSDQIVEGFYVEFPEHNNFNQECRLIHAIMTVIPDTSMSGMMSMLGGLSGGNPDMQQVGATKSRNTLGFCTIDIKTLQQIGEVEIGANLFKPEGYVKSPNGSIILT